MHVTRHLAPRPWEIRRPFLAAQRLLLPSLCAMARVLPCNSFCLPAPLLLFSAFLFIFFYNFSFFFFAPRLIIKSCTTNFSITAINQAYGRPRELAINKLYSHTHWPTKRNGPNGGRCRTEVGGVAERTSHRWPSQAWKAPTWLLISNASDRPTTLTVNAIESRGKRIKPDENYVIKDGNERFKIFIEILKNFFLTRQQLLALT